VPLPIVENAMKSVKDSSLQASDYLRRIKREAEDAQAQRLALEEERRAVAEKFALLDKEAAKQERERQATFDQTVQRTIADLEKRGRDLVARIENRTERVRAERELQRQVGEMKRAAQREVRVVRASESHVVQPEADVQTDKAPQYVKATAREIVTGDTVRLRSFGSVGIVDRIKDGLAEVRVKSLRFREKIEDLELVEQQQTPKTQRGKLERLQRAAHAEVHLSGAEQ